MSAEKEILRKQFKVLRDSLSKSEILSKSSLISSHLFEFLKKHPYKKIGFYAAISNEVDLAELEAKLSAISGYEIYYPRSDWKTHRMSFHLATLDELIKGGSSRGILEPKASASLLSGGLDLVLVPGLVFSLTGYRVGYGKGFYDRYFKETPTPSCGVAYGFQVTEGLPIEEFDSPVDFLVTEQEILKSRRSIEV